MPKNQPQLEIASAIASVVPKKMTLEALASDLEIPTERLEALLQGSRSTPKEAEAFARRFGGIPQDYREFALQEDGWFRGQPAEIQAQVQRLTGEALYSPTREIESNRAYSRKSARTVLVAAGVVFVALLHGLWLEHQYHKMRPEARIYMGRIYAHRLIAKDQMEIEQAEMEILKAKQCAEMVDRSQEDPQQKAQKQRFFLDMARFYRSIQANLRLTQQVTRLTLNDPTKWQDSNTLLDPFTLQPVNVEDTKGGQLDQEKIRQLVRLELRADQLEKKIDDVLNGRVDASKIPPMEEWGVTAFHQGSQP